jgi:hypothetical protein
MLLQKVFSGRPSKYDKQTAAKMIREVSKGASFNQAAIRCSVSYMSVLMRLSSASDCNLEKQPPIHSGVLSNPSRGSASHQSHITSDNDPNVKSICVDYE